MQRPSPLWRVAVHVQKVMTHEQHCCHVLLYGAVSHAM